MSTLRFENAEKELIPQEGIDSENKSFHSSQCSCLNCDSAGCFEKRNKSIKNRCQCSICKELRKKTSATNNIENKRDLEIDPKKIIRKVVTRETMESLKRVTETMYEFGTKENLGMIMQRQTKLSDKKVHLPTKDPISINTESSKIICIGDININREIPCYKQISNVQVPSADITEPPKDNTDLNNTPTKVSAQVMNIPYEDIQETVPSSQELTEQNPLSKLNIFKRIKEIYEACSCKVCECITSKPREIFELLCECKPCDCQECVELRKRIEEKIKRKDCRGFAKDSSVSQACKCNFSDSVPFSKKLTKQCKCEPCQCINCKLLGLRASKTVKLGEVDAYIERETCHCSPCECIECKQIYNRTNPTIMCTYAPYENRNSNICRCRYCRERCQLGTPDLFCDSSLGNSINKNHNDFDIRTVIVDNNGPFIQQKIDDSKKHNTVTLLASCKHNYPSHSCSRNACKCTECECLVCGANEDSLTNFRGKLKHNYMTQRNNMKFPTSIPNACKCTPCECEICSNKGEQENSLHFGRKCRCNVCDCLKCDDASIDTSSIPSSSIPSQSYSIHRKQSVKPIRCMDMNKNCNCNPCDCSDCTKLFSCSSSIKFYSRGKTVNKKTRPSHKVMLITPSTSESHLKSQNTYVKSVLSKTLSPKESIEGVFRQDLSTCLAVSYNYAPVRDLSHSNNNDFRQLYVDNKEYIISNDDVDRDMFLQSNNSLLDTASLKSVETNNIPIINYSCNLPQPPFKTYKANQDQKEPSKLSKQFINVIHKQQNTMTCVDSDEFLPVYSSSYHETLCPRRSSRNVRITSKKSKTNLKDVSSNCLKKNHRLKNKQDQVTEDVKYNNEYDNIDHLQESPKHTGFVSPPFNKEYRKISVNHSEVSIDHETAKRVLWEAKAFSIKLVKMLESFETANRQFESASQKLKHVHDCLLNINESARNNTYSTNLARISQSLFESTSTCGSIPTKVNSAIMQSTGKCVKDENQAEREYEQFTNKPKDVYDNIEKSSEKLLQNYISGAKYTIKTDVKADDINKEEKTETFSKINSKMTQKSNSSHADLNDELINKNENNYLENVIEKPTMSSVIHKLDLVFGKIPTRDVSVATNDIQQSLIGLSKPQEKEIWQILKKNMYLNSCADYKRTMFQSPTLELDIKDTIQEISLQTTRANHATNYVPLGGNEALSANLQREVKDLLNMPSLQNNSKLNCKFERDEHFPIRNKLHLEVKVIMSTASCQTCDQMIEKADKEVYFNVHSENSKESCEQLKAAFTSLRRVSDHTVLVKWSVPECIADVQGYELLVDGRAVQKIFSPTRSMAVVTCLPPTARVLLTVRTIAAPGCGIAPASTIVYRPKNK